MTTADRMRRIVVWGIACCLFPSGANALDGPASQSCIANRSELGIVPLDQFQVLRIDSDLKILQRTWTRQPVQGIQQIRAAVAEIQSLHNPEVRGVLESRAASIYLRINKIEASDWLLRSPSRQKEGIYTDYKAQAYSEAIASSPENPEFQLDLVRQGLSSGAFQITQLPVMLQKLQ